MTPEAERWIRDHVGPVGPIELVRERSWSSVCRVPIAEGAVWFKACNEVQAFEPRLSAELYSRWPDLVGQVLAYDEDRAWLLLADAGNLVGEAMKPWLEFLPRYAELQRGEARHASAHLENGVSDRRLSSLPARYAELVESDLPLDGEEVDSLRALQPDFTRLCAELEATGLPATVQHDDLHGKNLYERDGHLRLLDWGDTSISHPFFSLIATFRLVGESASLRDAYLEPWGPGLGDVFDLALRVGGLAHAIAWARLWTFLDQRDRLSFNEPFADVLRAGLERIDEPR